MEVTKPMRNENRDRFPDIPTPREYFGFEIGDEGRLAEHDKMMAYFKLISERSSRVQYHISGKTTLGNDYVHLVISTPTNLADLDHHVEVNQRLVTPGATTDAQALELASRAKPVLLIQAGLHSDEIGPPQAMIDVVHRLATEESDFVAQVLDNSILVVVPAQNPDGNKLFTEYFDRTANTDLARIYPDLYHRYSGHDNDVDATTFAQVETVYYVELISKFRPAAVQLLHQMAAFRPRMFVPPYRDPFDPSLDPRVVQQTNELGIGIANALTAAGKKGVAWNYLFNSYHPSFMYEAYHGIPNVLTEIALAKDLTYDYVAADGEPLSSQVGQSVSHVAPYDSTTWTFRQVVQYITAAAYALMENVSKKGVQLMYNQYQVARDNARGLAGPYAYVIPANQRDPLATHDLLRTLQIGEIEIERATSKFTAAGRAFPAGSHVIRLQQRFGRWADAMLKVAKDPDPHEAIPVGGLSDVNSSPLWMLFGVDVESVDDPFAAELEPVSEVTLDKVEVPDISAGAYLVPTTSYGVGHFLGQLQSAGVPTFRASEPFSVNGHDLGPGTLVVSPSAAARTALSRAAAATGIPVLAVDFVPKVAGFELKRGTRIGLIRGIDNMPGGWLWWLLDQSGTDFAHVVAADFAGELIERFDTIIMPAGVTKDRLVKGLDIDRYPPEFSWAAGIGEAGWRRMREFVHDGGNLVALGDASVGARELLDLPIKNLIPDNPGADELSVPGTMLNASFDTGHPIAWGMPKEWPIYFGAAPIVSTRPPSRDVAWQLTDASKGCVASSYPTKPLLRNGFGRGEHILQGNCNVVTFSVGRGYVVVAGTSLTYRSWSRATITMMFNALYHGAATEVDQVLSSSQSL